MGDEAAEKQIEELMPRISLTVIVGATIIGFALALTMDTRLETFNKILIVGAMLAMSVITLFSARFIVLPALARDANTPAQTYSP